MPSDTQKIRTSPGQPLMISSDDPTANESLESVLKERDAHEAQQNQKLLSPGLSFTVDLERKIVQQNISPTELKQLLRSKKRVNKLEERGKLTGSQVSFLKTAHQAHAQSRRNWLYILAGVGAVFCCVCAVLVIRVMHYQRMLSHGLTLEQKLDSYESKIQKVKQSGADTMLLAALVAELDRTNQELNGVQSKLNKNDVAEKFYADPLERKIDLVLQRFGETDYHIPAEMVARVKFHMEMFGGRMKPMMGRYIERKNKYAPMIEKAFRERNLPADLQYIAMLESGFNPEALSHAGARGMWQFMEHTGRRYGLQIDATVDERLDPQKATLAAAQYFKELIGIFGGKSSVMLAMAAYNAGEGRIMGALRKVDDPIRNRDFWYIYRMGYLAEETNEYIPRVIALLILSENQQEYGLTPGSGRSGGASTIVEEKPSAIDYFSPLDVEAGRVDSSAIKKFIKNF